MNRRILGYALIAVAIVGLILAFAGLDLYTSRAMSQLGLVWALGNGHTYGGLPIGLASAALVGVGLVGVGLLLFGKRTAE